MAGLDDRHTPPARFSTAIDELHELVARHTGATDFGPDDYLSGLRMLLLSMDHDPRLTEMGRRIAWGEVYSALAARAHAHREMARVDLDSVPIERPVVITGIPRTGTTALHKLLAVDPRFQGLQTWLAVAPMPRPPRETWESNPLFEGAVERLNARMGAQPSLRVAHNIVADEVEECVNILRQGFCSNVWTCAWSAPSYDLWWLHQSEAPSYAYLRKVLQLIGSSEPHKRWLLKNPGHIDNLDLLFETFPDALVIQTHRDPAKAVPSLCGILAPIYPLMEAGDADAHNRLLGSRETEKWAGAIRKAEPVRQAHPDQVLDIVHGDFHRDPMGTVQRIYTFIGIDIPGEVEAAMVRRIDAKPELAYGVHRYDLADFGLTAHGVRKLFGGYVERLGLVEPACEGIAA